MIRGDDGRWRDLVWFDGAWCVQIVDPPGLPSVDIDVGDLIESTTTHTTSVADEVLLWAMTTPFKEQHRR